MSSLRLLLSGSLVASGLILGAFTLQGVFDPQWRQKQVQAAARPKAPDGPRVNAFQTRTQFAGGRGGQDAAPKVVKAGARPEAKPADTMTAEDKAARAAARRKLAEKRRAEKAEKAEKERAAKAKQQPQPQQATLQWPWNWFSN